MNTSQLKKLDFNDPFDLEDYIIVDVRTSTEFFHGHIKGAKNIPFEKIDDWLGLLEEWGRPVIVCADWECTSKRACKKLVIRGVEAIDGGNWVDLEKKLAKNNLL
jgi:rhodanese-related sulfurtransferase